jgi:anti-sigma regulatory factor (Ser/Thr protein kinase)
LSEIEKREGPHELRLELPAAHSAGRLARQMLRQFAKREGVPEAAIAQLEFVAGELIDNAVDHGGGESAREEAEVENRAKVRLVLTLSEQRWTLRVGDEGGGSVEAMRARLDSEEEAPDLQDERGRGFFLLRSMVERLAVEKSRDGRGLEFEASATWTDPS